MDSVEKPFLLRRERQEVNILIFIILLDRYRSLPRPCSEAEKKPAKHYVE